MAKKKKAAKPVDDSAVESAAGFEESLGKLQQIVARLEDGSLPLEESMQQFENGIGLLRQCYQVLEAAEQRIEILTGVDRDGNPLTKPFDASATFDGSAGTSGSHDDGKSAAAEKPSGRVRDDSLF